MSVLGRLETETLALTLALFVVGILAGVGVLRLYLGGDTGALFRNLGIAVLLAVFSVALYRKWRREDRTEPE
jgi:heme A synthase